MNGSSEVATYWQIVICPICNKEGKYSGEIPASEIDDAEIGKRQKKTGTRLFTCDACGEEFAAVVDIEF